nr:uncharacterized protein LOC127316531 [Lolium perenne]
MLGGGLRRNPSRRLRPDRAGGRAASRCRVRGSAAGARPGGGRQHRWRDATTGGVKLPNMGARVMRDSSMNRATRETAGGKAGVAYRGGTTTATIGKLRHGFEKKKSHRNLGPLSCI